VTDDAAVGVPVYEQSSEESNASEPAGDIDNNTGGEQSSSSDQGGWLCAQFPFLCWFSSSSSSEYVDPFDEPDVDPFDEPDDRDDSSVDDGGGDVQGNCGNPGQGMQGAPVPGSPGTSCQSSSSSLPCAPTGGSCYVRACCNATDTCQYVGASQYECRPPAPSSPSSSSQSSASLNGSCLAGGSPCSYGGASCCSGYRCDLLDNRCRVDPSCVQLGEFCGGRPCCPGYTCSGSYRCELPQSSSSRQSSSSSRTSSSPPPPPARCGGQDEWCCGNPALNCNAGPPPLVCRTAFGDPHCRACGEQGDYCCRQNAMDTSDSAGICNGSLRCTGGFCLPVQCGGAGQDCCDPPRGLCNDPRLLCVAREAHPPGTCMPCGIAGEACCSANPGPACETGTHCVPPTPTQWTSTCQQCGQLDQDCCQSGNACANEGLTCRGGTCRLVCGGLNQQCCPLNPQCNDAALTCSNDFCIVPPVTACEDRPWADCYGPLCTVQASSVQQQPQTIPFGQCFGTAARKDASDAYTDSFNATTQCQTDAQAACANNHPHVGGVLNTGCSTHRYSAWLGFSWTEIGWGWRVDTSCALTCTYPVAINGPLICRTTDDNPNACGKFNSPLCPYGTCPAGLACRTETTAAGDIQCGCFAPLPPVTTSYSCPTTWGTGTACYGTCPSGLVCKVGAPSGGCGCLLP
jgi:hypothetical protein